MKIIQTKPSDWNKIKKHVMSIEKSAFEEDMRFVEKHGDFEPFLIEESVNLIALDGKKYIGYLMSSRLEDDSRYRKDGHFGKFDTVSLDSIAIVPSYQGRGVGKKLFKAFLGKVAAKRIVLDATSPGMERLALSEGFRKVKHFKSWEGKRSSWLMVKRIKK